MATLTLRDFIHDGVGDGVAGIKVQAFAVMNDGSFEQVGAEATTDSTGEWEITLDTVTDVAAVVPGGDGAWTGYFRVEIWNPNSAPPYKMRVRRGDIQMQAAAF